jgi:hypothetical protein
MIGDSAFSDCKSLTSISIPQSVKKIGTWVFSGCSNLMSISISKGCKVEDYAFRGCTGLTSITIPESVTYIYKYAFLACGNITDIYYSGDKSQWRSVYLYGVYWSGLTIHCTDGDLMY